ncbi:MAG: hypothetical protein P4N60_01615 [Verrucomicrobiae bacterium]|nr:hypothetical protein [Verrucomicrobiae bacterium]
MGDAQQLDQDSSPQQGQAAPESAPSKAKQAYSKLRRELNEDELKENSAAIRFLLKDLDRLYDEGNELKDFRERFHACDKDKAVLEAKKGQKITVQIIKDVCFVAGGSMVGLAPTLWITPYAGLTTLLLGISLIICGIVCRIIER